MSYFTEVFEETAELLETKSQTRANYEYEITDSRQSNEWKKNNHFDRNGKGTHSPTYSGRPGSKSFEKKREEANKAAQPMRTAEDYRRREKLYGKNADYYDKNDKSTEKYRNFVHKHPAVGNAIGKYEKSKHESVDATRDYLEALGYID